MEGTIKLKPVKNQQKRRNGGGGGQAAQINALQKQVEQLTVALQTQIQMQTQMQMQKPIQSAKPKNKKKATMRPKDIVGLVENPSGNLPVYHRLDTAFRQGGVHRVNEEITKIENELRGSLSSISFNDLKIEMTVNGKLMYLSQMKPVWYIMESFIRKAGKEYKRRRVNDYGDFTTYYEVNGVYAGDYDIWYQFQSALMLLFLGPNEAVNQAVSNLKIYFKFTSGSGPSRSNIPELKQQILKNYFNPNESCYRPMKVFMEILRYCLTCYRTFYQTTSQKSKSRGEKPYPPHTIEVDGGGSGSVQKYKLSLMDPDFESIIRLVCFGVKMD